MSITTSEIPGYQITEKLHDSSRTLVYRGIRVSNSQPVVIKLLRQEYPTFNELVQFCNQYTITRNLDIPTIIKPYSLETHKNGYALVMEDFGGLSLAKYIQTQPLNSIQFLPIAILLANTLHQLHQQRVIHKDIKPANILINPTSQEVKLIDFSIASLLPRETQESQNHKVIEGTLAYISPEQTGRMNRGIDYRSDFYSLGVTFFELLTGKLPFFSDDIMELIHCHIAKEPPLIHSINSGIPPVLSAIVAKLMAKNAEERYQSASGLKYDLEICLQQLEETGEIANFPLGQRDTRDRFLIAEKLYGRELEVKMLLEAFDRVASGTSELMLVAGFSGIGKTAVVNEVHKPIVRQRGYFIKGKFDQFNRNIPFSAFVQAFRDLIGQLGSETDTQLQQWRTNIQQTLGANAQVIIEVIPELEKIIGKQALVTELTGSAAQNRFNLLFSKFVQIFTKKEHPLVIFLDDLQWADLASLKLMQVLISEENRGCLLLIGAYRDNEVSPVHPLMQTVDNLTKSGVNIERITLDALDNTDVNNLIADTLNCQRELAQPLTDLVYIKTKGNPFFTTQLLKSLYEDGLIVFNPPGKGGSEGGWECDIGKVRILTLTDDVVEFIGLQLQKLSTATQNVLKLAACIGNQFDLETLAIVYQKSVTETASDLWNAVQEGLILPQSEVYKFFLSQEQELVGDKPVPSRNKVLTSNQQINYRFLHDRVQQAAYSLIPDNQKQTTHYHIGQLLLHRISPETREERIFELVNQLNYGTALINNQIERDELAQLNLIACRKARAGTAYQAAQEYADLGLKLLGSEAWEREYAITLQLHELAAESAALTSNFDAMYQRINAVIEHSKTILEQVEVYIIKIQSLTTQNLFLDAISCGEKIIKELGINFPECITPVELEQETEEIQALIGDRAIEELFNLPKMVDAEKLAIMKIALRMVPACFLGNSPLFPLLASLQVKLSLQYGNSPISSTGYADYGIFINFFKKDITASNQFGQLAYRLALAEPDKSIRAVTFVPVGLYLYHHQFHLRDTIGIFQAGYEAALEVGKLDFVGHNVQGLCVSSFWSGKILTELEPEIFAYYQILLKFNLITSEKYALIFLETILFLLNNSNKMQISVEPNDDQNIWLSELLNSHDPTRIFYIYLHRATLRFLLGYMTLAKTDILQARQYLAGGAATICEAGFYFYDSLIALATIDESSTNIEIPWQEIEENQANLELWATYAPMNYLHKWQLVEAEKNRVLGNKLEAIEMYDRAIAGAQENGYSQEEALANELAAKFYLDWGKEKFSQSYMIEAYYCYFRWGAKAKIADLEKRYPQLLTPILQQKNREITNQETIGAWGTVTSSSSGKNLLLDFASVIKAAQAISSEIELEKLLATLMEIVIKNAGAQTGSLILHQEEQWLVVARANQEQTEVLEIPLEQCQDLPQCLIYSVARSQEIAVFDNLSNSTQLARDRYVITHQPKSVLCTPISKQGKVIGILYLENNLTEGAFTRDRVETLQLLTSQAAIALENANLYQQIEKYSEKLEEEVALKTQDLRQKALDLEQTLKNLQETQAQLIHSEKMSSLGQLVAGIAHEINNPINFIIGNIDHTEVYVKNLLTLIKLYQEEYSQPTAQIQRKIEEIELEFIWDDLKKILESMKLGSDRIRQIILSLRNFSRLDESEMKAVDLHQGIESTLMILESRIKGSANKPQVQIIKKYGNLPNVTCYASQLNQVFLSLITNALDALQDSEPLVKNPQIIISSEVIENHRVRIGISDNGLGIATNIQSRIFDPFFTTKSVGKGTGLGLAVSYAIVKKHGGKLTYHSTVGEGTEFSLEIPI